MFYARNTIHVLGPRCKCRSKLKCHQWHHPKNSRKTKHWEPNDLAKTQTYSIRKGKITGNRRNKSKVTAFSDKHIVHIHFENTKIKQTYEQHTYTQGQKSSMKSKKSNQTTLSKGMTSIQSVCNLITSNKSKIYTNTNY